MSTPSATLTAATEEGARLVVVDCAHGQTAGVYRDGTEPAAALLDDPMVVRAVLERHDEAAGCRCTAALRRRYGVAL